VFLDGEKKGILAASFCSLCDSMHQYNHWCSPPEKAKTASLDPNTAPPSQAKEEIRCGTDTAFLCFPFSNFRYSLTLFSKFFASFPHGTCTLSACHPYLAFDGIYHRLGAAIPNNSTRWHPAFPGPNYGNVTLSVAQFQGTFSDPN
jgi:hypothetical protein